MRFPPPVYTNHSMALRRAACETESPAACQALFIGAEDLDELARDYARKQDDVSLGLLLVKWERVRAYYLQVTGKTLPLD
jgi:hypothetical protein